MGLLLLDTLWFGPIGIVNGLLCAALTPLAPPMCDLPTPIITHKFRGRPLRLKTGPLAFLPNKVGCCLQTLPSPLGPHPTRGFPLEHTHTLSTPYSLELCSGLQDQSVISFPSLLSLSVLC